MLMEAEEMTLKAIRRRNLRCLADQVGGITRLAERLGKTQSQVSHVIGRSPIKGIGDRLAAQAEKLFDKPVGWLDRPQEIGWGNARQWGEGSEGPHVLCQQVPLISWEEVNGWHDMATTYLSQKEGNFIPVAMAMSSWAFALRVRDDTMESPQGFSIPQGAIIIVEPESVAKVNALVVVTVSFLGGPTLKQLIVKDGERYLKPLNPRYPIVKYLLEAQIHGVVKQMQLNFNGKPL